MAVALYWKQPRPAPLPGRTTVGVTGLARDALVEVDLVLYRE